MSEARHDIAAVVIGRNEGQRLRRCLETTSSQLARIVYVDSGSTDGSIALARGLGARVVELDTLSPFTAARARNAGADELLLLQLNVKYIQFIDGDCALADGWIDAAAAVLDEHQDAAVVCGRRREQHPDQSIYNRLIDMEWNTPVGEADSCGGDALVRLSAFREAGGFNPALIAGEEPELCLRLRRNGNRIMRIDHEMTRHDANLTRFRQWWKRAERCGHAYAEARYLHGSSPQRFRVEAVRSVIEWALLLPLTAIGLAWFTWGLSLLLLAGYPVLWQRIRAHQLTRGCAPRDASMYALFCVLGKFPELLGIGRFWFNHLLGRRSTLIEYKLMHSEPAST